jgi:hypothetical protein
MPARQEHDKSITKDVQCQYFSILILTLPNPAWAGLRALHSSSLRRTISTPHSSKIVRLEFGTFYFAVEY